MSKSISIALDNNHDNTMFTHYLYKLTIYFTDNQHASFEKVTDEKYINIITPEHKIKFNDISKYTLVVTVLFANITFSASNNFIVDNDIHVYHDDNLYVEVTKNKDNYANCCVNLTVDNSHIFFTPPNY